MKVSEFSAKRNLKRVYKAFCVYYDCLISMRFIIIITHRKRLNGVRLKDVHRPSCVYEQSMEFWAQYPCLTIMDMICGDDIDYVILPFFREIFLLF